MKTSEAIKKIKALSKHYTVVNNGDILQVSYKNTEVIYASNLSQYSMYFDIKKEYYSKLPFSNKLYMILAEYVMTPLDERLDDHKKYYVKVPHTDNAYYWKFEGGALHVTSTLICYPEEKQFTMKEIKKLGLENYELVEVEE